MEIFRTPEQLQAYALSNKRSGKTIALVPTMGYLHAGHASLIDIARSKADVVIVSIFVNPIQFGPSEDLDKYPRDFEHDSKLCKEHGADAIFAPEPGSMLEVKSDLSNYSAEEVIHSDYKEYEMNGKKVGIGLAETLDPAPLLARRDELAGRLAELKRQDQLDHLLFGVKDIENGALYLIVADSTDQAAVKRAFSGFLGETRRGWLVLTKTSRKKTLVPAFNREMTRTIR